MHTNSLYTFFSSKNVYVWSISHLQTHSINKAVNFRHSLPLMLMKITEEGKKNPPHRKCSSPSIIHIAVDSTILYLQIWTVKCLRIFTIFCRTVSSSQQATVFIEAERSRMEGLCSWEIMELFSQLGLQAFYPLSIACLFTGINHEIHCFPVVLMLGPTQLVLESDKQLLQFMHIPIWRSWMYKN